MTGPTRLAAVIGDPVRHSLSPAMHNAVFASAGLDWRFVALEVVAGGAVDAIRAMEVLDIAGLAVTMPHKSDAAKAVDEIDEAARLLHSVNTVVLRSDGSTFGASTDGPGFVDAVEACGYEIDGWRIVVIGAGAAARSIVHALGRAGAAHIAIVNRTATSAHETAALADSAFVGSVDDIADADLIVNTTPVGMGTDDGLPVDPALIGAAQVVADIVYHPLDTALLRAARERGAATIDGLGMLVHQAVLQQELWTGRRPDPAVLRAAATAQLATRSGGAPG